MPVISLTDFIDVVAKSGTPKLTKIAEIIRRPPYSPATDYYRGIREHIVSAHQNNLPKNSIDKCVKLASKGKQGHYKELSKFYKQWWGNKSIKWFNPPRTNFGDGLVSIRVNPELGLSIDGDNHIIKLYFKTDKLAKNRAVFITHLMNEVFQAETQKGVNISVLDIRRKKLFTHEAQNSAIIAGIKAELGYISMLWNDLE
ncbi:hypothetical protein ACR42D_13530 [Desulfovibrio caledoniensis]